MFPPTRIVCLTEETVETLYLLGEQGRIVGISSLARGAARNSGLSALQRGLASTASRPYSTKISTKSNRP